MVDVKMFIRSVTDTEEFYDISIEVFVSKYTNMKDAQEWFETSQLTGLIKISIESNKSVIVFPFKSLVKATFTEVDSKQIKEMIL